MSYKCYICGTSAPPFNACDCPDPEKGQGFKWEVVCERVGCNKPSCGKSIYGLGYLASVCEQHYNEASIEDKQDAIRFKYAE